MDYLFLNIVGYIALVSSMSLMLFNADVRTRYYERHGYFPLLTTIDLIYSAHGFLLTLITTSQLYFWGFKSRPGSPKRLTKLIILVVFVVLASAYYSVGTKNSTREFTLLDVAVLLSYIKIFMSLIKYIPQLNHNYKRKSVVGFSILTIVLDTTGGTLSIAQLFLDAYIMTGSLSWEVLRNNSGKLGLSAVTLFFDACFVYQWYIYKTLPSHDFEKIEQSKPISLS